MPTYRVIINILGDGVGEVVCTDDAHVEEVFESQPKLALHYNMLNTTHYSLPTSNKLIKVKNNKLGHDSTVD